MAADTETMAMYFSRCTGTPRWAAVASPNDRAFNPLARNGVTASARTMIGPAAAIFIQVAPASEPSCQKVRSRSWRSSAM